MMQSIMPTTIFIHTELRFILTYQDNDGDKKKRVVCVIKCSNMRNLKRGIIDSTWRGIIMKTCNNDKDIVKMECYDCLIKMEF